MTGVLDQDIQPAPAFSLKIASSDPLSVTIVAVGELDFAAGGALATVLGQHADWPVVVLDVSRVTFLDCSCLGILVASRHRMQMLGGRLTLRNVNRCVDRMLELTNLKDTMLDAATAPTPSNFVELPSRADLEAGLVLISWRQRGGMLEGSVSREVDGRIVSQRLPAMLMGPSGRDRTLTDIGSRAGLDSGFVAAKKIA